MIYAVIQKPFKLNLRGFLILLEVFFAEESTVISMAKMKVKKIPLYESVHWSSFSPHPVVGVDEVGRGCLAGPVYAAAVCLQSEEHSEHFTDSKILSEKRRDEIAPLILSSHWVGIGFASVEEIDQLNIFHASLLAMKRAVREVEKKMKLKIGHLLVDGSFRVPGLKCEQTPLVKGDLRCSSISAASIVAKVTRDCLMTQMGEMFPNYGFEQHKGYGSPAHKKAIEKHGPCVHHRKSFSGVKEFILGPEL